MILSIKCTFSIFLNKECMLTFGHTKYGNLTNKCLEPGPLSSTSLFLDRHDLQDFIFKRRSNEEINDLKFLSIQKNMNSIIQMEIGLATQKCSFKINT
jgi:hypothetical protein